MMKIILGILLAATMADCGETRPMNDDNRALRAIKELHEKDRQASLDGDLETLLSLFTEDGMAIPTDGEIVRGKDELRKMLERNLKQLQEYLLVEYIQDFKEIRILGDYAYEWGSYSGKYISKKDGSEITGSGKLMRILKLDTDGSWKVSRSIWTVDQ